MSLSTQVSSSFFRIWEYLAVPKEEPLCKAHLELLMSQAAGLSEDEGSQWLGQGQHPSLQLPFLFLSPHPPQVQPAQKGNPCLKEVLRRQNLGAGSSDKPCQREDGPKDAGTFVPSFNSWLIFSVIGS